MELNSNFYCVLTLQLMVDPVMDIEGNTYERAAIEEWIKKDGTSPITRNPISISDLGYNRVLKCAIAEEVARAQSAGEKKGTKPLDAALPVMPDDIMDLSAAIGDITVDEIRRVQEALITPNLL